MESDLNPDYPVFANTRPWNELILRGLRTFKTMSFRWKYRGTVYLYDTKAKGDVDGSDLAGVEHDVDISENAGSQGCIVGTVEVYDCEGDGRYFEIKLRNPERLDPIPFKYTSRGRIARIKETA